VGKGGLAANKKHERTILAAGGEQRGVTGPPITGTERLAQSPVLAGREQTWTVVSTGVR
jgi:hypothetical protein